MTDTHEETWYVETVKAGQATWSSIYQWEDKPEVLAIAFNQPLYGPGRQLLGVIGVDFVLSQLNTWLAEVWKDRSGFALIVERNGMVVASSRPGLTSTGRAPKPNECGWSNCPIPWCRPPSVACRRWVASLAPAP